METGFTQIITPVEDLSHRLRRLHFFDEHFQASIEAVVARAGLSVRIDRIRLTDAFLAWGESFTKQRAVGIADRRDFMIFTAGMLLAHLLEKQPVTVLAPTGETRPAQPDAMDEIVAFWPEGFLYTSYCIGVLQTVIGQETREALSLSEAAKDLHSWWSFQENVREDLWSAVGFLDLFVGVEPNFRFPTLASARPAIRRAAARARLAAAGQEADT